MSLRLGHRQHYQPWEGAVAGHAGPLPAAGWTMEAAARIHAKVTLPSKSSFSTLSYLL